MNNCLCRPAGRNEIEMGRFHGSWLARLHMYFGIQKLLFIIGERDLSNFECVKSVEIGSIESLAGFGKNDLILYELVEIRITCRSRIDPNRLSWMSALLIQISIDVTFWRKSKLLQILFTKRSLTLIPVLWKRSSKHIHDWPSIVITPLVWLTVVIQLCKNSSHFSGGLL